MKSKLRFAFFRVKNKKSETLSGKPRWILLELC